MQISIRKGATDSEIRGLLDREFDGTPGLVDEFPLLVGAANRNRSLVAEADGRVVAHAAWRALVLRVGEERLPAAGVGLVTAHRDWRGRGLATQVVEACMTDAWVDGAWIALLFAPSRSLYARLGFMPAGQERVTRSSAPAVSQELPDGVRTGDPKDASRLLPLLERHPVGVERTVNDFETLLRVPDTRLYLLEEGGRVLAYCIEGRGRDLRGVIHEWAGDPPEVSRLLKSVSGRPDGPEWILSPGSLPAPLEGIHHRTPMAQVRILRPADVGTEDPVEAFGDPDRSGRYPIYVWGLDSF
jgi:predicted N-acetyltransferase YhbS